MESEINGNIINTNIDKEKSGTQKTSEEVSFIKLFSKFGNGAL